MLWDPPLTAGVLNGLSYQVFVVNTNTDLVIVNVTTEYTNYSIAYLQPCADYKATITPFLMNFEGDSTVTSKRTPGGMQI